MTRARTSGQGPEAPAQKLHGSRTLIQGRDPHTHKGQGPDRAGKGQGPQLPPTAGGENTGGEGECEGTREGHGTESHITRDSYISRAPISHQGCLGPRVHVTLDPPTKHQCSERNLNECLLSQTLTDGTVSTLSTAACKQCRRPATTGRVSYVVSIQIRPARRWSRRPITAGRAPTWSAHRPDQQHGLHCPQHVQPRQHTDLAARSCIAHGTYRSDFLHGQHRPDQPGDRIQRSECGNFRTPAAGPWC